MTIAKLYEVKALLNQARNKTDDTIPYFENLEVEHAAALSQITDLGGQLGSAQTELALANAEIDALNAIIAQLQQPAPPPLLPFVVYNEIRQAGSMAAEGLQDILFIYQNDLHPTSDHSLPPDVDHLRSRFASIKAEHPGVTMVVLNQEEWLKKENNGTTQDGKFTPVNVPWYVTLVMTAREFFEEVSVYMFPERYTGFLTGSNAGDPSENDLRLQGLWDRFHDCAPLIDAVTFFVASFYYINPCHLDAVKRDQWITDYVTMMNTVAPGKRIIPALGPRYHPSVPEVELRLTYIPGDYWRATMETIKNAGCAGLIIWTGTGSPDPRDETPEPAYWTQTKDFVSTL